MKVSRLDKAIIRHNELSMMVEELNLRYKKDELNEYFYQNEYDRLMYEMTELRCVLSNSLTRSKDPVTLVRRLRSSCLKNDLLKEIS